MNTIHILTLFVIYSLYHSVNANESDNHPINGPLTINWTSNTNGNWFNSDNWDGLMTPASGDFVSFGATGWEDPIDNVDIDNAGIGVVQANDKLTINDKVNIFDSSAMGDPLLADDKLIFDIIEVNGEAGSSPIFNVEVVANIVSSNRHGGIFNRELTVDTIISESNHQDRWEINQGASTSINLIIINENRGSDGDTIDGYFSINSDLQINQVDYVWGNLRVGNNSTVIANKVTYWDYTTQDTNNNINPITLNGNLIVNQFMHYDAASDTTSLLPAGTYGRIGNLTTDFEVDWIESGDGILEVVDVIFNNSFELTVH